jgi:SAM-dependent methyltransferase
MAVEQDVARHYGSGGGTGDLLDRIRAGLRGAGVDPARALPADLKPVDEFHTGGMEATDALLDQLEIGPGTRVLDIGCGIGGTARAIAERYGARVTGVDLTPEYVAAAAELSRTVGLDDRVRFQTGSAVALPVGDGGFDLALLLHVGMNIEDKPGLFREARRALVPGGTFALFEVMQGGRDEALAFPVPWAARPETSFVAPPDVYRDAALAAGFEIVAERDRTDFARAFFDKVMARVEAEGPPPLGIHLLMGETAREKIANYVENLKAGRIAPTELICRAPS